MQGEFKKFGISLLEILRTFEKIDIKDIQDQIKKDIEVIIKLKIMPMSPFKRPKSSYRVSPRQQSPRSQTSFRDEKDN